MNEKVYKSMGTVGVLSLVMGICVIVISVGVGVTSIVSGVKLIKERKSLLF